MKRIVLCADDFGQNNAISQGILNLISSHKLSATSCLVGGKSFYKAKELLVYDDKIDIGLHLDLTFAPSVKEHEVYINNLKKLVGDAYLGKLRKKLISREIEQQLQKYIDLLGKKPDFLDGHQHIQQLPIIREAILEVYDKFNLKSYIRLSNPKKTSPFLVKKMVISLLGGKKFKSLLIKNSIPFNNSFSGIYNFKIQNYRKYFLAFITEIKDKGLIMCHPGKAFSQEIDSIKTSRELEFNYLNSSLFTKDIAGKAKITKFIR